jgi:AraC family transcriptional regulator
MRNETNALGQSTLMQGEYGRVTLNLAARPLVEHAHSEYNCIFKIGGGDTPFRVDGKPFLLEDNTAMLINPWQPHAKLASLDGPTVALTLLLEGAWLSDVLGLHAPLRAALFPQNRILLTPDVREQANRLALSMSAGVENDDTEREGWLRDLVLALARNYGNLADGHRLLRAERPMDARVVHAIRLIRMSAAQNPNLDDIARRVGLSRSRFFEQFKLCVGASPQQYLDWERMALATRMLAQPNTSVAQVSDQLEFSAPSHFARFFVQHIGLAPREFKRGLMNPELDEAA